MRRRRRQMMRVGDRDGERVGGVGAGDLRPGKQARDHRVDLRFFGIAGADDGLLHQPRGIFADRRSRRARRPSCTTPRAWPSFSVDCGFLLTNTSSTAAALGPVLGDQRFELARQRRPGAAAAERPGRSSAGRWRCGERRLPSAWIRSPAGRAEAGVETEDPRQASPAPRRGRRNCPRRSGRRRPLQARRSASSSCRRRRRELRLRSPASSRA